MKKIVLYSIRTFTILLVVGIVAISYAFCVEPNLLVKKTYTLGKTGSNQNEKLRVVQISDTHVGEFYSSSKLKKMVKKVNASKPDIVIFTGDLFDNYAKYNKTDAVMKELQSIHAVYGKYAIWGNRDYGGGAVRIYGEVMTEAGFRLLKNEAAEIELPSGKTVCLGGVDDSLLGSPEIETALGDMTDSDYRILLTHEPDIVSNLKNSSLDLILAGHSHGGQVNIPFVDMIKTKLAKKYTGGFYQIDKESGLQLYVNTGIGMTRIPVRFMVPPQIAVFEIRF